MKCTILHESAGRLRVHMQCARMTLHQADVLEYYLRNVPGVTEVKVYDRTQDAVVLYSAQRGAVIAALAAEGTSEVSNVHYIERGYEDIIGKLRNLGAQIDSVECDETVETRQIG